MPSKPKAVVSWSSGKDSAYALQEAQRTGDFDIVGALTTVTTSFGRVSTSTRAARTVSSIPWSRRDRHSHSRYPRR